MPTGYTAKLMEQGQTFEEFAMTCARNFGALIMMRDEPLDTPIPERFEPSHLYAERLAALDVTLSLFAAMTVEQKERYGADKKAQEIQRYRKWLDKERAENARLDAMEEQVLCWEPPTPDHQGLKGFMLQQINTSKNNVAYYVDCLATAVTKSPTQFYEEAIRSNMRDIDYCTQEHAKEIERVQQRNEWLRQLRHSLGLPRNEEGETP